MDTTEKTSNLTTVTVTLDAAHLAYVLDGAEFGAEVAGRLRPGLNAALRKVRKAFRKAGLETEAK